MGSGVRPCSPGALQGSGLLPKSAVPVRTLPAFLPPRLVLPACGSGLSILCVPLSPALSPAVLQRDALARVGPPPPPLQVPTPSLSGEGGAPLSPRKWVKIKQ